MLHNITKHATQRSCNYVQIRLAWYSTPYCSCCSDITVLSPTSSQDNSSAEQVTREALCCEPLWLRGVEEYSLPVASETKGGHQMCRLKHANDLKRDGQPQYPAFDAIEGQQLDSKITLSITAMLQHFIRRYT